MKKVIAVLLSIVLVTGLIGGGIFLYKKNKDGNKTVGVYSVSDIKESVWDEGQSSYGSIRSDLSQEIYADKEKLVKEVCVNAGDQVTVGDVLLKYDTTLLELELSESQNNLEMYKQDLVKKNNELTELKKITPVTADNGTKSEIYADNAVKTANDIPVTGKAVTNNSEDQSDIKVNTEKAVTGPVSIVDTTTEAFAGSGTNADPYRYMCEDGAVVKAELLKKLGDLGKYASFEVYEGGTVLGTLSYSWRLTGLATQDAGDFNIDVTTKSNEPGQVTVNIAQQVLPVKAILKLNLSGEFDNGITISGSDSIEVSGSYYITAEFTKGGEYVVSKKGVTPTPDNNNEPVIPDNGDEPSNDDPSNGDDITIPDNGDNTDDIITPDTPSYTKDELNKKITEKNQEISKLQLDIKEQELTIQKKQKEIESYTVKSTVSGVVKTLKDSNTTDATEPFLVVNSADGYYITGYISELALDTISVGEEVSGMCWSGSGTSFTAKIVEISEYPESNADAYNGDGNPNVSYYPFVAFIADTKGLKAGDYAELSFNSSDDTSQSDKLYLPKYMIKDEAGKYYVYAADESGVLEKRYITTGKTFYGSSVEIIDGVTVDDKLAFPYGKDVKAGVKTKDADIEDLYK